MTPVLTSLDLVGLQGFVYASQRLRDIAAASDVVASVLSVTGLRPHVQPGGEVVFASGGNALVTHPDRASAVAFVISFTSQLALQHPSLALSVCHHDQDPPPTLAGISAAQAMRKLNSPPIAGGVGFGFTATCVETGQPARGLAKLGPGKARPTSAELIERRRRPAAVPSDEAIEAAREALGDETVNVSYPSEIDDLCRGADKREVSVVHIDGTGIGRLISDTVTELNPAGCGLMRDVANELSTVFADVTQAAVLAAARHPIRLNDKAAILPLRPVLQGGDDLTFICRAPLAIPLIRFVFEQLKSAHLEWLDVEGIPAGAGAMIAPVGAPLWSLIDIAHQLTTSAKHRAATANENWAYDWHVGLAGDDVARLREQHFSTVGGASCTDRPYIWGSDREERLMSLLDSSGDQPSGGIRNDFWRSHRSALHRLIDIVALGDDQLTLESARLHLRHIGIEQLDDSPSWRSFGWETDHKSVLLDAVELRDRWEDL